jgi:hypothetical protein
MSSAMRVKKRPSRSPVVPGVCRVSSQNGEQVVQEGRGDFADQVLLGREVIEERLLRHVGGP